MFNIFKSYTTHWCVIRREGANRNVPILGTTNSRSWINGSRYEHYASRWLLFIHTNIAMKRQITTFELELYYQL